jgi:hypothetical protein
VPNQGGPRLSHPQVVTVTFAGDSRAPIFESFARWIVGSKWLTAVGHDYGISAGAVAGVAHRPETPPGTLTSAAIEAYLAAGVADGSIPRPAAPYTLADALYIAYYPSTTAITTTFVDGIIKQSRTDYLAYHGEVHASGLNFSYAVAPDCGVAATGLTAIETIELGASHEFIEAATDAFPITKPAYQLRADPTSAWYSAFQFEVEVGDLCEVPTRFIREAGFVAQRIWSNSAALVGDPCVPVEPTEPYFGVSATPDKEEKVAPGATVDYTVQAWSTGTVPDFQVVATQAFGIIPVGLSVTPHMLNNGGTALLQVVIPASSTSGQSAAIALTAQTSLQTSAAWVVNVAIP